MDVAAWLRTLGLEEHAATFAENGVDGALLLELTNEDLKDLGISRLADRKRLLKAIEALGSPDETEDLASAPILASPGERRQVTVLFADLCGYTQLSRELDAEDLHAVVNRFFDSVDAVVERYGGAIDKHIGDAVMALFGAPIAHGDDSLRAARAACDMHAAVTQLGAELRLALRIHVGIAAGQVVAAEVGRDRGAEYTVVGDTVNLASRLVDMAQPGETLLSDAVHRDISRAQADAVRWTPERTAPILERHPSLP